MKKRSYQLISEFLKTNSNLVEGSKIYNYSIKTKSYWPLGTWKSGKVWSNAISMTLEPEKTFVKV